MVKATEKLNPTGEQGSPSAKSRVCVIGAGTMGSGIAQVTAQAGIEVALLDRTDQDLSCAEAGIRSSLDRLTAKDVISQEESIAVVNRIHMSTDLTLAGAAEILVEAIFEDFMAKSLLLDQLNPLLRPDAIVASNTSSISITALASRVDRPERFVGMHFFNPVVLMPLVEIVRGLQTAHETVDAATSFVREIGKEPVSVGDAPGFVANRILMPMINEAIFCVADNVAGRDEIDSIMCLGANHPMGPLALADLIGLDVCLSIMEVLHRDFGDDKYRPAPLLRQMVAAGKLGRKSGQGFYVYNGGV